VFQTIGELGQVPRADLERTLNMGVGFVAMLPADQADTATRELEARGIPTWVIGEVMAAADARIDDRAEVVRGAKGVEGGAAQLVGEHPASPS
jgi:phosphoribosylformylglycinamidine cyclo-ligase